MTIIQKLGLAFSLAPAMSLRSLLGFADKSRLFRKELQDGKMHADRRGLSDCSTILPS